MFNKENVIVALSILATLWFTIEFLTYFGV